MLDIIGGELWDASYLICAYILMSEGDDLIRNSVLELGSGLGLPSLLIAKLKLLMVCLANIMHHHYYYSFTKSAYPVIL